MCNQVSCTCTRIRFFHSFDIYHWNTEYIPNHSLMTWHRRHRFSSERALVNNKLDFADIEHFRFSWLSGSTICVKIPGRNQWNVRTAICLLCIVGAFTKFAIFENRIYFKTRCSKSAQDRFPQLLRSEIWSLKSGIGAHKPEIRNMKSEIWTLDSVNWNTICFEPRSDAMYPRRLSKGGHDN